jgi:glycerol-3-phosphate dehydrogenase (NAD(P)+)
LSVSERQPLAVLGAGAWGTALAVQFARGGRSVRLWGRDPGHVREMQREGENRRRLPGVPLPAGIEPVSDLDEALADCTDVLVVVPSHSLHELLQEVAARPNDARRLAWATKGFEPGTGRLAEDVAREVLGEAPPLAVLSGPTFATEVGRGLPTAIAVASRDAVFAADLAASLHGDRFRAYTSPDIVGAEVGGAVKNVIAIAAGVSDGLEFGANARVALITRGLAEMMRLGLALGGRQETFMGLAGMGDLVLTCTDDQSRNRRFGKALARGLSAAEAREEVGLAEGANAVAEVRRVASKLGVEMPICDAVHALVVDGADPRMVAERLLERQMRPESEEG